MPTIPFRFKHETKTRRWETEHTDWPDIRYELENRYLSSGGAYLVGIDARTDQELTESSTVTPETPLILVRRPLQFYLRPYVPPHIREKEEREKLQERARYWVMRNKNPENEEDVKLFTFLRVEELSQRRRRIHRSAKFHASTYGGKLPDWYECLHCGAKQDHMTHECETPQETFVPLAKRASAAGIPRSFLRTATQEEARTVAMVLPDGSFVMRKRQIEQRS